jgi:glycosyltransferase involved in cell wall biosynthesis
MADGRRADTGAAGSAVGATGEPSPGPGRPISVAYLGDANSVHVRRFAAEFDRRGYTITLLVPEGREVEPGLPERVAIERFEPHTAARVRRLGLLTTRRSIRRTLARVRPDILHVHHLTVNGFRAWMSGHHPYVVTVWGTDVLLEVRRSRRASLLGRLALRSADLVTGISRHVVDAAVAAGARRPRTRVIHFGVDVERFAPGPDPGALRKRLGLEGRRVVFSPRLIDPIYRQEVVVEAVAGLPEDVALVLTGYAASPAELTRIEKLIDDRGLRDRVRLVPSIPHAEMADYYRLADAVVSVPISDSGPVTLVEALAVGRPVVSSDLPPVREWLADLDPECLVPVGDVAATVAALASVLARTAARRAELATSSRAAVLERADQRKTMDLLDAEYRRLAAEHRRLAAARLLESRR